MILTPEQLQDLGMAVFREAGVPEESAASVVEALVRAELDGLPSHGFSRIPFYVDQALSGKVKAQAIPLVRQPAPAAVLVDAGNGFAFPAILAGLEKAIPLARRNGVSVLGVTRSHHCGVVGLYAERIAEAGLISLIFSNTPAAMAPWNGSKASFGTNPLAFGCPREGKHPLVIDMSLSKVARGKIMGAKQRGEAIPEGWALDAAGRATTDPVAALGGPYREGPGEINVPIVCCGQSVEPGDIILGDRDGVIVIPSGDAASLYDAARQSHERDLAKTENARRGLFDRGWVDGALERKGCEIVEGLWR